MHGDIERVLFTEARIRERIAELGKTITEEYRGDNLVLMALLKGGVVFISDLMRHVPIPLDIDFIVASSYGAGTVSSGSLDIKVFPQMDFKGKRLLVLDDILDTGRTLLRIVDELKRRGAEDVRTCVLLDKKARRIVPLEADYVGFPVDDVFVVGYGLDFADKYRNLPYIGVLKEECYAPPQK
jgi:hypoxanthine phosphoribosyltransferase